jgi:osmoprotectant transport system ATP-binding protein
VPENSDNPTALGIELEHLTKVYPGVATPAVNDVSIDVPAGELVAFVGPSGCGKTTTMKLINRLIEPSSGVIRLGGEDVTHTDPVKLRRRIGYVIQSIGLFPHMTIADNVGAVPKMLGWSKKRIAERNEELLTLVGLEPAKYISRYPRQLSGGQQQRVGVARALAADPPVLLMDEPFGATDPITRLRLQREFRALQQELGKTVIFVTHDFEEALLLGDRIAVLAEQSRVVQYDRPLALLANPADEHVRSFVGSTAHIRLLGLLPAAGAADPNLSGGKEIPASATLRDVTDLLLAGAETVSVVDERGTVLGGADFASVRNAVAAARSAEIESVSAS